MLIIRIYTSPENDQYLHFPRRPSQKLLYRLLHDARELIIILKTKTLYFSGVIFLTHTLFTTFPSLFRPLGNSIQGDDWLVCHFVSLHSWRVDHDRR